MNNKNFFFCYNKKVSSFLTQKGVEFITVAIDPKTKRMYSLYPVSEKLQMALDEYKTINQK